MKEDRGALKQIEIYRKMSGKERLRIGCELYDLSRKLIESSIRNEKPAISDEELKKRVIKRMHNWPR